MNEEVDVLTYELNEESTLGLAALFEDSFSIDALTELTGRRPSEILTDLIQGEEKRLLIQNEPGIYSFRSKKEKNKMLDDLPQQQKEKSHRDIAKFYLKEPIEKQEKVCLAAHHFLRIQKITLEECYHLIDAGDVYLNRFNNEGAVRCYSKVLQDLVEITGEDADIMFVNTAIKYSKISTARHKTSKTLIILEEAMARAESCNKPEFIPLLQMHVAKNEWLRSRFQDAIQCFQQAWSATKEIKDPYITQAATTFIAFFLYWQGRFKEVVHHYQKAVQDVEKYPMGKFPILATLAAAVCYTRTGQINEGLGMMDTIINHCTEKGDLFIAAQASAAIGHTLIEVRHLDDALQYLKCAMEEAEESSNKMILINASLLLAYTYYLRGEKEKSISNLHRYIEYSNQVQVTVTLYPALLELCWAMHEGSIPKIAGLELEKEISSTMKGQNIYLKGIACRYKALLHRKSGGAPKKVISSLKDSLKFLEASGCVIEHARSLAELSHQQFLLGDEAKAEATTQKAAAQLANFNDRFIPSDLKKLVRKIPTDNIAKDVLQLSQELTLITQDQEIVRHIVSSLHRIVGAERSALFVCENGTSDPELRLRTSKNLTSEQTRDDTFSSSMEMIKEVITSGKPSSVGIPSSDELRAKPDSLVCSRICVPIILKGKTIGALYHDNRVLTNTFEEQDHQILTHFAALAAFALDSANASSETHYLTRKLEAEKKMYQEQSVSRSHFKEIIGKSAAITEVLVKVEQVAPTDTTILITGETGVGKELIAGAIHRYSRRSEKAFIDVHCSSLPESLITSELFGHEKGAFTGAVQRRIGRFELANEGTLFLDEVATLPMETQIRLLRVLQNRKFERVGGHDTLQSDFRLIAATNKDLYEKVKDNSFRSDLYYRLNVFPISIPSLRERKEDIPLLAFHFLEFFAKKAARDVPIIEDADMQKLIAYDWPGNIRELQNIIERGVILSSGDYFRLPELETTYQGSQPLAGNVTLKDNERNHILWALHKTGWKVRGPGGSAELLDIHPSTLAFRMKKLGITRSKR